MTGPDDDDGDDDDDDDDDDQIRQMRRTFSVTYIAVCHVSCVNNCNGWHRRGILPLADPRGLPSSSISI